MKIHISNRSQASVLALVLVLTAVLGLLLASYLVLLNHTNRLTTRSQLWNMAIPVSEAGVEDALTHLNVNGETNLATDGWTKVTGQNVFWKQASIGGNTYLVTVSNYVAGSVTNQPVIESRAYVRMITASMPGPFMASAGVNAVPDSYLARGVQVKTGKKNSISKGLIAKGSLQIQSYTGNYAVDSYDSTSSTYSTNGKYDSSKRKHNGFLGTNSRVSGNMQVQTAKIIGMVGTGAANVLTIQSPARIGDWAWVNSSANNGKVKPGHHDSNLNLPFPDVPVPFTSGFFTPGSGSVGGTNYTYLLSIEGAKYRRDKIELKDEGKKMLVTANATLYVTDSLLLDKGHIIIAPGKTLTVYVEKAFEAKGSAKINADGVPSQFMYYGRPINTSFQVMDTAQLVGVFYAPGSNAQFQNNSSLCGGGTFNSIQIQHNFQFHYDEALGGAGNMLFFVSSWSEMTPQQVEKLPTGVQLQLQ